MIRSNLLISGFMVIVFSAMILVALQYPRSAGLAPCLIAIPGLILAVWQLMADLRNNVRQTRHRNLHQADSMVKQTTPAKLPRTPQKQKTTKTRDELVMFGWVTVILALFLLLGFWVGLAVFLALFILLYGQETWKTTLLVSTVGWLCFWGIFHVLLKVSLFQGFLHNWFF